MGYPVVSVRVNDNKLEFEQVLPLYMIFSQVLCYDYYHNKIPSSLSCNL